jgi:metal-responsive CopG/Arc/MetJ family transcriptional regulator
MQNRKRGERLQIMLLELEEEFRALDDFRFSHRMPSRAAAIREALRRGLGVKEEKSATAGTRSSDFGVLLKKSNHRKRDGAA